MIGCLLAVPHVSCGTTVITNTRAEIAFMAGLWEADSAQISSLANAQLPKFSNDWQYIFPSGSISADGDLHIAMAVDGSGYGSTNGNTGTSPIIAEVVNVTAAQFAALRALKGVQAKPRGIFRFYNEHIAERHFKMHPVYASAAADLNGPAYLTNGQFQFGLAGVPGYSYVIQASTNPVQWRSLQTNHSPFNFVDPNASQFPRRFYRGAYFPQP